MREPANVLLIGNEPEHLQTQATVLKHFWQISAAPTDAFDGMLARTDLVVLCHSLTDAERQPVVRRIKESVPSMLIVKINGYDSGPHDGVDAGVDLYHGPGCLVSTVYELLTERGVPSKSWFENSLGLLPGIH